MAQIIFNIPDAVLPRVVDAVSLAFNYLPTLLSGGPNPETKGAFTKRMIANEIKKWVAVQEGRVADDAAQANAQSQIDIT